MKRLIWAAAAALVVAGVAHAAKPPITAQPLGTGQLAKAVALKAKPGDLTFVQAKVQPGGDFGWHIHRAPVAVAVVGGTLTLYDSSDPKCRATRMPAGSAFVEQPNHVHLARNEGKTPVRLLIVYLGAPHGESPDAAALPPAQCSAVK
jgi:quercetin dioxygenase-like cupin family protein